MSAKLIADMRHQAGELDAREKSPILSHMLWTAADALAAQAAEIKRLRAALTEIADLPSVQQDECGVIARAALRGDAR